MKLLLDSIVDKFHIKELQDNKESKKYYLGEFDQDEIILNRPETSSSDKKLPMELIIDCGRGGTANMEVYVYLFKAVRLLLNNIGGPYKVYNLVIWLIENKDSIDEMKEHINKKKIKEKLKE